MRDFFFVVCALITILSIFMFIASIGYAVLGLWGITFDEYLFFRMMGTSIFVMFIFGILTVLLNDNIF
jgi:hypothetical protein